MRTQSTVGSGPAVLEESAARGPVLLAGEGGAWADVRAALAGVGLRVSRLPADTSPEEVARRAAEQGAAVIVDLTADLPGGLAIARACRAMASGVPVVVIAGTLSLDTVQEIRGIGVFYVAVAPVTTDELRSVLRDAFRQLGGRSATPSAVQGAKRVLVVDDDDDFRGSIEGLLRDQGSAVTTARSGREAMAAIAAQPPDLLVLDVMMEHDCAGYEVTQALRWGAQAGAGRRVPILMLSSIEHDPMTLYGRAAEAPMIQPDLYLTKPVDVPEFLASVGSLLRRTS